MNYKLRAESHELKTLSYELRYKLQYTSYELRATSFRILVKSYELRSVKCRIPPAPADDSTVQYLDRSMIKLYIDRIQLSRLICAG